MDRSLLILPIIICTIGQGSSFIHFIPGRQPNNTYVKEGEMVSCYCEYSGTESLPYWRVNETDYSVSSVPVTAGFIANASGLFFEARLEMDSTNFQCFFTIYKSGQFQPVESSIGTVFVEEDPDYTPPETPLTTCDARPFFTGVLVDPTIELFWSLSGCSNTTEYCINYTRCDEGSLIQENCTHQPPLEYQNKETVRDEVYFTLGVEDGSLLSNLGLNAEIVMQQTEKVFTRPHSLENAIIFPVPGYCETLVFCIFPDQTDSSGKCYLQNDFKYHRVPPEYGISDPINPNTTIRFNIVIKNVTEQINGTLHTLECDIQTSCCGGAVRCSVVANSSILIVTNPPSQPETPCLYLNNRNATLCTKYPHSNITITSFDVNSDCGSYTLLPEDLCKPLELISNCTPTEFNISARNEVGTSIPSESVFVDDDTNDFSTFCTCLVAPRFIPSPQLLVMEQNLSLAVLQLPAMLPDAVKNGACQDNPVLVVSKENDSCIPRGQPEWSSCTDTDTGFVGIIHLMRSHLCPCVGNITIAINVPIYVADSPRPCHLLTNSNTIYVSEQCPDPNPKSDSDGLTAGAIAGIVTGIVIAAIAAVGAIAAAAGIIYKCWSGERKKKCETSSKQTQRERQ